MRTSKRYATVYWVVTIVFAVHMAFTAYAQLMMPQIAQAFTHLGFPQYFRIELAWAKLAGLVVLLVPAMPERLKEWAYAGFSITLVSAVIAHLAVGEGPRAWGWAAGAGVLLALSYFFRFYSGSAPSETMALPAESRA